MDVFLSPKRQGSSKGVLRKFKGCFKEVSRKFKGCIKGISRNLLKISLGVSSEIYECYKGDLRIFKEVNEVSGVLRECFKEVFNVYQKSFKESFVVVVVVVLHSSQLPEQKEGLLNR